MSAAAAVLDLCGGTGSWSRPFAAAGYPTAIIDIKHGYDVRTYEPPEPPPHVYGVLAAPPCTVFARGGARWWATRPAHEVDEAVDIVRACLRIIRAVKPVWWALENPAGRLRTLVPEIGPPAWDFQPYEYMDFYSKSTYVWTNVPKPPPTTPDLSWAESISAPITKFIGHHDRAARRSITPAGFAEAFYRQVTLSYPPHSHIPGMKPYPPVRKVPSHA